MKILGILKLFKTKTFDFTAVAGILVVIAGQFGVDIPEGLVISGFVFLAGVLRWITGTPMSEK